MKTLKLQYAVIMLLILALGILFHYRYIADYPNYVHAWAQADRYALALGFVNNNLNLFYPETFILNSQFPFNFQQAYSESITAVDFPIHEYILACIMKLTGITSPYLFRGYTLLYSFLGLFFLFRLSRLLTNNFFKSVLVVVFAATSPCFVYYQGGFLPSIPCLSNAIIGIYFYVCYYRNNKRHSFGLAILFLTLATLTRTTFVIALIAVLCFEFLRILNRENIRIAPKILPLCLSAVSIVGYFMWNSYLRSIYGCVFLSKLALPESLQQIPDILNAAWNNWKYDYFSDVHYWLYGTIVLAGLFFVLWSKIRRKQPRTTDKQLSLWWLLLIWMFGCLLFGVAMMNQFRHHDYYILDSFFFPIIFGLMLLLSVIPDVWSRKRTSIVYAFVATAIVICLSVPMITHAVSKQESRRTIDWDWDWALETIYNYQGSSTLIDSLHIAPSARILVLNSSPVNMPFILMNRKGYYIPWFDPSYFNYCEIETYLSWKPDYIVVPNVYFIKHYRQHPELFSRLKKVGGNNRITFCTLSDTVLTQTACQWLDLEQKQILLHEKITFDSLENEHWGNVQTTDSLVYAGIKSGVLPSNTTWGLEYRTKDTKMFSSSGKTILFSGWIFRTSEDKFAVVLDFGSSSGKVFYKLQSVDNDMKVGRWEKIEFLFQVPPLPEPKNDNLEMVLYLFSTENTHQSLYYDNVEIIVY